MLTTAGGLALKGISLVAAGACLAIGFYIARKGTNKIDEMLMEHELETNNKLRKDMGLEPVL
jgi:hypothetical protein